jgi:hypothetical protein
VTKCFLNRLNQDPKHVNCQVCQKIMWDQINNLKQIWSEFNCASYRKQNENNHDHLAHVGSQKYYGKSSLVQWLSTQLCKFLRIAPNRDAFWNFFYPQYDPGREATILSFYRQFDVCITDLNVFHSLLNLSDNGIGSSAQNIYLSNILLFFLTTFLTAISPLTTHLRAYSNTDRNIAPPLILLL